ncbi:hypothetical protein [Geobacter sp.]|uniref:hypothetical protein n=1 Tax=Geobacter sp. TaxID=46610 RepID=UPI002605779F|nr:hypothetical protein [Geobacter sp.]
MMRRGSVAAVLFLAQAAAGPVRGEDGKWLPLQEDARVVWLMEEAPARAAGPVRTIRLKRIFKGGWEGRAYSVDTLELDCARNLYRYTELVIRDAEDDVFHRYRLHDQFCPVPPETAINRARAAVCPSPGNQSVK